MDLKRKFFHSGMMKRPRTICRAAWKRIRGLKILYISKGREADYQCDMLFHGLRSLFGPDVVDVNRLWFMYANSFGPGKHDLSKCYGRGFTLYGLLPDDDKVDRTDILRKIKCGYFSYVIYGSVHRDRSHWKEVSSVYPASKIILIDGEDSPAIAPVLGQGIYFKRELTEADALPIQFAIPKEKILAEIPAKTRKISPYAPWELRQGHIYETEADYYQDYGQSYFARTRKKAGWDCLRHYEIMAAGTLPYFERLEECPSRTMELLPKSELLMAREMHDTWPAQETCWPELMAKVSTVLREKLTTEAMAKHMLERIAS
jgi:hypothetical protein